MAARRVNMPVTRGMRHLRGVLCAAMVAVGIVVMRRHGAGGLVGGEPSRVVVVSATAMVVAVVSA